MASRILATRYDALENQIQQDEALQQRMTFNTTPKTKGPRPTAERVFSKTVTGVAIIENMDDVDEEMRPSFDLDLLDACLILVEPVEATELIESPLRVNGAEPTFESRASDSVERDGKKKKKLSPKQVAKLTQQRLADMHEDGYVIFDDAFLLDHPQSRVARLAAQYARAHPLQDPPARVVKTGKAKRCKRAAYFVSAAEKEQRPCFRRCPSELFYGRAQYTDALEVGIPLTSSFHLKTQSSDSFASPSKPKAKSGSKFMRIFKNFSTNSLEQPENAGSAGCSSGDDSDSGVQREVNIPPRVASVSIEQ